METVIIKGQSKLKINSPVFIAGLPGIGNVGKIAVDYLIEKLEAKKIADLYSSHLPPQVMITESSRARLVRNELYFKRLRKKDYLFFTGDFQGLTSQGQYDISFSILEYISKFNPNLIITLGGYQIGKLVEVPRVLGAYTSDDARKKLESLGVVFSKNEPGGGIIGGAGLLLGLGYEIFNVEGVCLMGETSGYFSDPKSAKQVVSVLAKFLNLDIDIKDLEDKAKEIDELTNKMMELPASEEKREDLGYFG